MATVPRGIGHFFSVPVLGFSVSGLTSRTTSDDCKDGYRVLQRSASRSLPLVPSFSFLCSRYRFLPSFSTTLV